MNQQDIVSAIEARARACGMSIRELCRRADLHPTTFSRWKLSPGNPEPIGATLRSVTALEAALTAAEIAGGHIRPERAA